MKQNEYIGSIAVKGNLVNIGLDDYAQCYYFEYYDKNKDEIKEASCGTYNFSFLEEIYDFFDHKGTTISLYGKEYWNNLCEKIKTGYEEEIDPFRKEALKMQYDQMISEEYETYDFEELYKEFEEEKD